MGSRDLQSLTELRQFEAVARTASFAQAGRELKQTPAAVSFGVKRMESILGAKLFERSTRHVRLTSEGHVFLRHCLSILHLIDVATDEVRASKRDLAGSIKLTAPSDFARTALNQWVHEFRKIHPGIQITVFVADTVVDIHQSEVDLAIRFGVPDDSRLIARLLSDNRRVAVASPDYVSLYGKPEHPVELSKHHCLCYFVNNRLDDQWRFYHEDEVYAVNVYAYSTTDDSSLARQWAIEGDGIVYKSLLDVQADLKQGRLVKLFDGFLGQPSPLYLLYPSRDNMPARLRVFIDFLMDKAKKIEA